MEALKAPSHLPVPTKNSAEIEVCLAFRYNGKYHESTTKQPQCVSMLCSGGLGLSERHKTYKGHQLQVAEYFPRR